MLNTHDHGMVSAIFSTQGQFIQGNKWAGELWNLAEAAPPTFQGHNCFGGKLVEQAFEGAVRGQSSSVFPVHFRKRDGRISILLIGLTPILHNDKVDWIDVVIDDLTSLFVQDVEPSGRLKVIAPNDLTQPRVLVADDNPMIRKLTAEILLRNNAPATTVADGEQALLELKEHDYDLVLIDVRMPKLGGLDVTRMVRAQPDVYGTSAIVGLSAHDGESLVQECLQAGMDDFVVKPLSRQYLLQRLPIWLKTNEARRGCLV